LVGNSNADELVAFCVFTFSCLEESGEKFCLFFDGKKIESGFDLGDDLIFNFKQNTVKLFYKLIK
jgi:hypothetical protein